MLSGVGDRTWYEGEGGGTPKVSVPDSSSWSASEVMKESGLFVVMEEEEGGPSSPKMSPNALVGGGERSARVLSRTEEGPKLMNTRALLSVVSR